MLNLENQIKETEMMEDSVLKEVTLFSLNRQMVQFEHQLSVSKNANKRKANHSVTQKQLGEKRTQKLANEQRDETSSSFLADNGYIEQIG